MEFLHHGTGAVIRDIINVSTRRNPNVNIKLYPIPVQGKGAETKIVQAIKFMDENKIADVLILARGGGSIEDLWPFNEEIVARAIYEAETPIISAIGHETDFTIADFVADLRAPTPSAAAELAQADVAEMQKKLEIGQIVNTHGIKGEIKVTPFTNDITRFDDLKEVYVKSKKESKLYKVEGVRYHKNMVLIKLEGINTPEQADLLRNAYLEVDREHAVPLEEGTYYIVDLIGLEVYTEEGKLISIIQEQMTYM